MENLADSLVGTIASQSDTCGTTFKVNQVNGMVSSINLRSDKYFYNWHTIQYRYRLGSHEEEAYKGRSLKPHNYLISS